MLSGGTRRPAPSPRPHLGDLPACPHGGITEAELRALGLRREEVLDVSASTNPLAPSPRVVEALRALAGAAAVQQYPDEGCPALRAALAHAGGVRPESVSVANGSIDVLWLLALAYLRPGDRTLVVEPTFGEYARAARVAGAEVIAWRATAGEGFRPATDALAAAIGRHRPRLVFLCNPNNPTGVCLDQATITRLLAAVDDGLLVVDEAYAAFAEKAPDLRSLLDDGRLFLLRSLTKDYGLAGLRLGYALAAPAVIDVLDRVRPPWSVNVAAQAAGLAALADREHLARARREVAVGRAMLTEGLMALGLHVYPSVANFLLVEVGDGRAFRAALLGGGVCVRDCTSFGLPSCVRFGVRARAECARVLAAVGQVLTDA